MSAIGTFLYNYQFQLLRLIPFVSRLADLMQRESLIATPRERLQVQAIAQYVGQAMHELVYATAPVAHLVRDIQIGEEPGAFRVVNRPNSDLAQFVTTQMADSAAIQRAPPGSVTIIVGDVLPPAQILVPRLTEAKEQELTTALQALRRALAEFATAPHTPNEPSGIQDAKSYAATLSARIESVYILNNMCIDSYT